MTLVVALVALSQTAVARVPRSGLEQPARTRLGLVWQRVKLNLGQARRQTGLIARNAELGPWTRARKAVRATAGSLGCRRPGPVLLYQGAFDPVHRGHLTNLRSALCGTKGVGEVYVVPTSEHPGKHPVPFKHRVAMLRAALAEAGLPAGVKVTVVDDPRLARLSPGGFDDLTAMIHTQHPGASLHIMTGADAFNNAADKGLVTLARRWGYRYAVTPRAGYQLPASLPPGVKVMPLAGGKESSTRIRAEVARGQTPPDLFPSTLHHIQAHGLYGTRQ